MECIYLYNRVNEISLNKQNSELSTQNNQTNEVQALASLFKNTGIPLNLQVFASDETVQNKSESEILSNLDSLKEANNRTAQDILKAYDKFAGDEETRFTRLKNAFEVFNGGEADKKLHNFAKALDEELASNNYTTDTLKDTMKAIGIEIGEITPTKKGFYATKADGYSISARSKSDDSIYSKLRNKVYDLKCEFPKTLKEAQNLIGDAQGLRITMDNLDSLDNETANSMTLEEWKARAEIQSGELFEGLRKAVENREIILTEVENYRGEDGIAYASEDDLKAIKKAHTKVFDEILQEVKDGKNTDYKIIQYKGETALYDIKTDREVTRELSVCKTKTKQKGYCAAQVGLVNKDGQFVELQIRGTKVDKVAQGEHIVYDIESKKETVQGPEYAEIRAIVNKIQDAGLSDEYTRYFSDLYLDCRHVELGAESKEIKIDDYEKLVKLLTPEELHLASIEGLNELRDKIKADKNANKQQ